MSAYRPQTVVYFVAAKRTRLVKIGVSEQVEKRFAALKYASPDALELLVTVPTGNPFVLEDQLHCLLTASCAHGEWFRRTAEVSEVIELAKRCSWFRFQLDIGARLSALHASPEWQAQHAVHLAALGHIRWHVKYGIFKADCALCVAAQREKAA